MSTPSKGIHVLKLQDMLSIVDPADLPQIAGQFRPAVDSLACSSGFFGPAAPGLRNGQSAKSCMDLGSSDADGCGSIA